MIMTVMPKAGQSAPASWNSERNRARPSEKMRPEDVTPLKAAANNAAADAMPLRQAVFHIIADAEASLLPRLIEPFAKQGLLPYRVHVSTECSAGEEIRADLRVAGVNDITAHSLEKALSRIIGVRTVQRIMH
jgi:hypothetical protein